MSVGIFNMPNDNLNRKSFYQLFIFFIVCVLYLSSFTNGVRLTGRKNEFAKFPKWNACINATLSFEFKTRQDNVLLMYTDDSGSYDFFEVTLVNRTLRVRINIVDGREGSLKIFLGENLNDNRWHKVEIKRNRFETTVVLDDNPTLTKMETSIGSDFNFGSLDSNSHVFFGGMPQSYFKKLETLALPSVMFQPVLNGEIRNVIYGNCSCGLVRGKVIAERGQNFGPPEICEVRNPCDNCLCISLDDVPECKCTGISCKSANTVFYHLPMDAIEGRLLVNPSGLDSIVHQHPPRVRGALDGALQINGQFQWIEVTGPGHRYECFGDLSLCPEGYTLGFWIYFRNAGDTSSVYLSNGGHDDASHGVAMLYRKGHLEFVFRKKNGEVWRVEGDNVLSDKWYHVSVTWKQSEGLVLYINGNNVAWTTKPQKTSPMATVPSHNRFVIGRSNDGTGTSDLATIMVDEFKFWSEFKTEEEIREIGPMYRYHITMDQIIGDELIVPNAYTNINGNIGTVEGKVDNAVKFTGDGSYIDIGDFRKTCFGDVSKCIYGFYISFWVKINAFGDGVYYFSSGVKGFDIFTKADNMHAVVWDGKQKWEDSFHGIKQGHWHFIEVTWSRKVGLALFSDLNFETVQRLGTTMQEERGTPELENFVIGRGSVSVKEQVYPNAVIDDVEMFYGERNDLLYLDLIQRGKPTKYHFGMDMILGDRLMHPSLLIETSNNKPRLVKGKIKKAVKLNGQRQTIDFGEQSSSCFGNLDHCHHGALFSMWFKPSNFRNDMVFFSSGNNGITMKNRGNELKLTAETTTRKWETSTDVLSPRQWYFLEISWDPETGLELFVDEVPVAEDLEPEVRSESPSGDVFAQSQQNKVYLGRGNVYMQDGMYGEGTFDELDYWYGPRDYLVAFGYLQRGKPQHYLIDMERKRGMRLDHSELPLKVSRTAALVPGVVGKALELNGIGDYLDIGKHRDSCLGNLAKCSNGITISAWLNFDDFRNNMYIMSTGNNGLRMFYKNGNIHATIDQDGRQWEVSIPRIPEHVWSLFELTWHPDFGLSMYVNNTLVDHSSYSNVLSENAGVDSNFFIGKSNTGDSLQRTRNAAMKIDEMEIWYGRRDELIAFNYLLRDNIQHETFSMESQSNGIVRHPRFTVTLANGARLAPGKIGNAVSLDGAREFVDLGIPNDKCLANINRCKQGITISLWVKARKLEDGVYILSSPSYSLFYRDRRLFAKFNSDGKTWEVSTPRFYADRWHNVDVSWTPDKGLALYLDGSKADSTAQWSSTQSDRPIPDGVLLGKTNDRLADQANPDLLVDEVQYWLGPRNQVLSAGQIGEYLNHQALSFDRVIRIINDTQIIDLPTRNIRLYGNPDQVRGQHGNAIRVNGKDQYMDLGNGVICGGNIEKCPQGFTLAFSLKPERLLDNMYFLDSFPVSVFYKDQKLFATTRTPNKSWTVSAPEFEPREWHLIELTWHDQSGLTMFLNGEEAAHESFGTPIPANEARDWNPKMYFGRALTNKGQERYADATIERLDVWNARKNYLESYQYVAALPDSRLPDRRVPDSRVPDSRVPDSRVPDRRVPDSRVPDSRVPDRRVPDSRVPDSRVPDSRVPDRRVPDSRVPDSRVPDSRVPDSRVPDSRVPDTRVPDSRVTRRPVEDRENINIISPINIDYRQGTTDQEQIIISLHGTKGNKETGSGSARETVINRRPVQPNPNIPEPVVIHYVNLTGTVGQGRTPAPVTPQPVQPGSRQTYYYNNTATTRTNNIIRFFDDAYINYDFASFGAQYPPLVEYTKTENFTMQFITQEANGLIWMDRRADLTMYLAVRDGYLVFVIDDQRSEPREVILRSVRATDINDWRWHTLSISREGRQLMFYLDDAFITTLTLSREIQLVSNGNVYLGGSPDTVRFTGGKVTSGFNGALTQVIIIKTPTRYRVIKVSLLQYVESAGQYGNILILRPGEIIPPEYPSTKRPPPTPSPTTPRPIRTPAPPTMKIIDTLTFFGANANIRGIMDLQSGGNIIFRFKTFDSRGIIFFTHKRGRENYFFAMEIFDGRLYFVMKLGREVRRMQISNYLVNDGNWHDIRIQFTPASIVVYLDQQPFPMSFRNEERQNAIMDGGIYIAGVGESLVLPWPLWSYGETFNGCFGNLRLQNIRTSIRNQYRLPSGYSGVQYGCSVDTKYCRTNPCIHGNCINGLKNYRCDCMGTGYMGDRCEQFAVIGGFDGQHYVGHYYATTQITHTNDISLRFRTHQRDAFLFQTVADDYDQYIRGELEDGRIKVTIRTGAGNNKIQTFYIGSNLNDREWHTFNLRRRAKKLEMWVDDDQPSNGIINDEDYFIHINKIYFGTVAQDESVTGLAPNYIGYLRNVYFNNLDIFRELRTFPASTIKIIWIENEGQYDILNYNPVTFTSREVYSVLETLPRVRTMRLAFKFKTSEPNGVILFNKGRGKKFLGIELVNGYLHFMFNNGYSTSSTKIQRKVDDNQWHVFEVREVLSGGQRHYDLRVDNMKTQAQIVGNDALDLVGPLYIGGLTDNMLKTDNFIKNTFKSSHGFMGCMASVDLNGATPDLRQAANDRHFIMPGCVSIGGVCPDINPCSNGGVCHPGAQTFTCNCDMTAYAGPRCEAYPLGIYFGKNDNSGSLKYTFKNLQTSNEESIAFGFMTYVENGILARFQSQSGAEYIEIRLHKGFLVADYDTGYGKQTILLDQKKYSDGNYHIVTFIRNGQQARFVIDGSVKTLATQGTGSEAAFNKLQYVYIGGRQDSSGAIMNQYNGIIGGLYWNGYRFIDLAHANDARMTTIGDVTLIGPSGYVLVPPVVVTVPPPSPLPPYGKGPVIIPGDIGGVGVVGGQGGSAGGAGGSGPGLVGIGGPGSTSGGAGGFVIPGGSGGPITAPLSAAGGAAGGVPVAGAAGGVRAGALMGTILGTMAFMASLMWAFWQCKPGMIPLGGGGGGGGGGGAPAMSISSPTATNLPVAQALGGGPGGTAISAGSGGGAGGGSGGSGAGGGAKVTILNGSATGGGGGGSGSAFSAYYSSSGASASTGGVAAGGGGGGMSESYDSATLRATGTFSNKGTTIGTPKATRAYLGSSSATGGTGGSSSYSYSASTTHYNTGGGGGYGGSSMDGMGYGESTTADYDMAPGVSGGNYQSNTLSVRDAEMAGGTLSKGYSTSTMSSSYNYQVQNVRTMMTSQGGHHMMSYGSSSSGAVTPGAAGDEVRVDCCLMTGDGRSVVTGSSLGPPQVWDMSTGELLRIMKGDTVGSTNLHLACDDKLLVGAVHADLEINDFSTRKGVTNKKLQIWNFGTGRPLEMESEETCSALCVMSDPDKVVFARSDKYGNATNFIVWDLLGNQPLKQMRYDAPVGNNDYINFLALSQNDRYCVAGFTNTFDNYAEFVVFDVTLTSYDIGDPSLLRLDANPDCTVILPRDEAVTGLRNGDLVVWSLRTGQPSRQLLSGSGVHAHSREIKAVALSKDNKYLVSASADGTLKIWDMATERQLNTLSGHNDEVWCVAISPDNEIVVSGSRDGSIRLWRMKSGTEICAFTTGVDVFYVTMSHDKGTIVALGDKFGARKLIMLQVVRTKIRRQISS